MLNIQGYLTAFFIFFSAYLSADLQDISKLEIELSAECEPLTIVAGCVNVIPYRVCCKK
jgi:hypothetical protein